MRSALIVSAFAALALGAPRPQELDFEVVDAAPDPEIFVPTGNDVIAPATPAEIAALVKASITGTETPEKRDLTDVIERLSKSKRATGDCHVNSPATVDPVITPDDSPESFLAYQPYRTDAINAAKPENIPLGYKLAFSNLDHSSRLGSGLVSKIYPAGGTYNVANCAARCNEKEACKGFNIYYERGPSLSPGEGCMNPPSLTQIWCVLYQTPVSRETATNPAQKRGDFLVVQSGSNGYNKNAAPPAVAGFSGPVALPAAINAPVDPVTKQNTYMTQKFFSTADVGYNAGVQACVKACKDQTTYNVNHPPKTGVAAKCNFVVTFLLNDGDAAPQGVYCALYTEEWSSAYATNFGQYRSNGNYWSNTNVYAYTVDAYNALYEPICAKSTCPAGSYGGGNCGGYGAGTCPTLP